MGSLFVLLGFRLAYGTILFWLPFFKYRGELVLADLVSLSLVELFRFLVEFIQVELPDDVLLVERDHQSLFNKT